MALSPFADHDLTPNPRGHCTSRDGRDFTDAEKCAHFADVVYSLKQILAEHTARVAAGQPSFSPEAVANFEELLSFQEPNVEAARQRARRCTRCDATGYLMPGVECPTCRPFHDLIRAWGT